MNELLLAKFAKIEGTSDYQGKSMGKLVEAFKGLSFKFQDKRPDKRATFTFFHPTSPDLTLSVVLSEKLNAMYRAGTVSKLHLLGFEVVELDFTTKDGREVKGAMVLTVPQTAEATMGDVQAETYTVSADDLAGF
jgi:hypothetical protein